MTTRGAILQVFWHPIFLYFRWLLSHHTSSTKIKKQGTESQFFIINKKQLSEHPILLQNTNNKRVRVQITNNIRTRNNNDKNRLRDVLMFGRVRVYLVFRIESEGGFFLAVLGMGLFT